MYAYKRNNYSNQNHDYLFSFLPIYMTLFFYLNCFCLMYLLVLQSIYLFFFASHLAEVIYAIGEVWIIRVKKALFPKQNGYFHP